MRGLSRVRCPTALIVAVFLTACSSSAEERRQQAAKALISNHCAACHVVPGVAVAVGRVGPVLGDIRRQQMIAGFFANTPGMLIQWIEHPQRMLPGNAMPEMGLTHLEAVEIAEYLYTLGQHP
jgi:cytochrome c